MSSPRVGHSPDVRMTSRILDLMAFTSSDICFVVVRRIGEGQRDSRVLFVEMEEKKQAPNNQTPKPKPFRK